MYVYYSIVVVVEMFAQNLTDGKVHFTQTHISTHEYTLYYTHQHHSKKRAAHFVKRPESASKKDIDVPHEKGIYTLNTTARRPL